MPRYRDDPRWITARYASKCHGCETPLPKGARAYYFPRSRRIYGATCCDRAQTSSNDFAAAAFDEAHIADQF